MYNHGIPVGVIFMNTESRDTHYGGCGRQSEDTEFIDPKNLEARALETQGSIPSLLSSPVLFAQPALDESFQ